MLKKIIKTVAVLAVILLLFVSCAELPSQTDITDADTAETEKIEQDIPEPETQKEIIELPDPESSPADEKNDEKAEEDAGTEETENLGDNEPQFSLTDFMEEYAVSIDVIPSYSGDNIITLNNDEPFFPETDYIEPFEFYSELDSLGRCGPAYANVCKELMPTEPRGYIGMIKPAGWHTARYDGLVDGNYLYNRSHLIAYSLTGENANTKNLITGTRWLNTVGMLYYENLVENYVLGTGNHVLYRSTPLYLDNDLIAAGVLLEARSVEDSGKGICFNAFIYNIQPGIVIDYATGESSVEITEPIAEDTASEDDISRSGTDTAQSEEDPESDETDIESYILNKNTKKFHYPYCRSVNSMKESNKEYFTGSRDEVIARGFSPCGNCHP